MPTKTILRHIKDDASIVTHIIFPSPLRNLVDKHNEIAECNNNLNKVDQNTTGKELKEEIAKHEAETLVALLHGYVVETKELSRQLCDVCSGKAKPEHNKITPKEGNVEEKEEVTSTDEELTLKDIKSIIFLIFVVIVACLLLFLFFKFITNLNSELIVGMFDSLLEILEFLK